MVLFVTCLPWRLAAEPSDFRADGQPLVTAELLKARMDGLAQATGLDEGVKAALLDLYRKGLDNLTAAAAHNALTDSLVRAIETAPQEMQKLKEAMERNSRPEQAGAPSPSAAEARTRPLQELEQELIRAKTLAAEIETRVAALTGQISLLNERPSTIGQRLAELKENEEKLTAGPKTPLPAAESPQLAEARAWLTQTQLQALRSESRMLNQEMVSMPVTSELLNLQRDEAASRLDKARQLVQHLESRINLQRQEEARQSLGQAKEVIAQMAHNQPVLQQAAAGNETFSEALLTITAALKSIAAERDGLEKELKKIQESFTSTRQKIEMAGLSQALGLLLHELQRSLPDRRQLVKKLNRNRQVIAETGLLQVQSAEERKKLEDIDSYLEELTAGAAPADAKAMEPELRTLLANRGGLLDRIIAANRTYLGQLSEIEVLCTNLLNTTTDFNNFLAERLLWMRSTPVFRLQDFKHLPEEIKGLFAPGPWLASGKALVDHAAASPLPVLVGLLIAALIALRPQLNSRLETAINLAGTSATYHFSQPLQALGLTVLLALPWPLVPFTLGWMLHNLTEADEFSRSIGIALLFLAYRFFCLRILLVLLRPNGMATRIFFWPKATVSLLRRETYRFILTFLPIVFFTQIAFYVNYRAGSSHTLGRLSMLLILAVILGFALRLLHPRKGVWSHFLRHHPQKLLTRLYPLLLASTLIVPLTMAGLVVAGYVFAVGGLLRCLINSIWLAFGLTLCHQLIERWLIQSSRKLALKKAHALRTKAAAEPEAKQAALEQESGTVEEPEENVVELSMESRKLLNALVTLSALIGLWLVWFDVLPALRIFNQYTLWNNTTLVNGHTTTVPVTVADIGLTVLIGCLTLVATRHLPSLLKIILLQRLQMSAGSRYTVVTLTRYGIGAAGLLYIADVLGFSWSQIQWLIAALGVGIGFGLQEIVANFVSGLIILFERPIRVGDVVTIGTTDGVVTRIRIRATTIRDFDGKELLVPNKEFISGRLLNWSLSDPVLRILLPVGIAYGSDVEKAMHLMRQAAEEHPLVLDDPGPAVTFDTFGDNALQLTLRCFIGSVDDRVVVKSNLHVALDAAFREAGITMAFPQRDVHLDTAGPLAVRIVPAEPADQ